MMENDDATLNTMVDYYVTAFLERALLSSSTTASEQEPNKRNEILYIIYLSVLGCCCLSPLFYYIRLWAWQRGRLHRLRELERAGVAVAMARSSSSNATHDNESHMIREERRARMAQLMEPVCMVRSIYLFISLFIYTVISGCDPA